jgi:hypothetical protein
MDLVKRLGKNILNTTEAFTGSPIPPVLTGETPVFLAGMSAILFMLSSVIFAIVFSYGSAKLSYCYNKYLGATDGTAMFFAILCFFFSGFYYPYYSIFLSPICTLTKVIAARRR